MGVVYGFQYVVIDIQCALTEDMQYVEEKACKLMK